MGTSISRFSYWSDRRVRQLAQDSGIKITPSWWAPTSVKTPADVAGIPLPQLELARAGQRDPSRRAIAEKILKALPAEVTFDSAPPVPFARGVGRVELARYTVGPLRDKGVLLHVRTASTSGQRVDLCLFGSMDNLAGFRAADAPETGWSSSAWQAVTELLESRGTRNTSQWDDPESLASEVLNIALHHGKRRGSTDEPWTRGLTLGHVPHGEWAAEIYTDVVLDPDRWHFHPSDGRHGAERILVGAPLWVRTADHKTTVRYDRLRRTRAATWRARLRLT
jgi:hypothetical protein